MNKNQIAFIICTNDAKYYNECVRYIQDLHVPEGYSTDIICIQEANSMTQGYNAGMQASDAKYKVYLHHDTFILNLNFIYDILNIFQKDESIGLIGVIGTDKLSANANCYMDWSIGNIQSYDGRSLYEPVYNIQKHKDGYREVTAIDGPIMVTQYDIPWREDFLDGWNFYDISQSLEMRKKGYKVVVPDQATPWCYHDCGVRNMKKYDFYRARMIQEYPEIFTEMVNEDEYHQKQQEMISVENIRRSLVKLIGTGSYEELNKIIKDIRALWLSDTQVREIVNIMEIYSLEKDSISGKHSEWVWFGDWEEVYDYYSLIRFILLRIEHEREDERAEQLKEKIKKEKISRDAIRKMSSNSLKSTSHVFNYLLKEEQEEPLVSVIVAVYNGESIIRETIDSILQQSYRNLEIIIVDDASTDRSREIISSYKDSRIKTIFLEKNRHICYAGNVGFKEASGKYIALMGHDDIWMADKLEKQISFLEEHPSYSVCFTWVDIIDENKNIINLSWRELNRRFCEDNYGQNEWSKKLFLDDNHFCASSACIRGDALEKTGYYRYGLVQLQDYDLWLRLLCEGPVYSLQEKLTYYRRFSDENKNVSAITLETQNRGLHEKQWILLDYLEKIPADKFILIFKDTMKNKNASSEKEVMCEKAFLLWNTGNCFAEKWFIELLEDEECRNILEDKYQFELKDFYAMNTEARLFDNTLMHMLEQRDELLKEYQK